MDFCEGYALVTCCCDMLPFCHSWIAIDGLKLIASAEVQLLKMAQMGDEKVGCVSYDEREFDDSEGDVHILHLNGK